MNKWDVLRICEAVAIDGVVYTVSEGSVAFQFEDKEGNYITIIKNQNKEDITTNDHSFLVKDIRDIQYEVVPIISLTLKRLEYAVERIKEHDRRYTNR